MLRYALLNTNPLPISNLRLQQEMSTYSILGCMVYTVCPVLLWHVLCPVTLLVMLTYVYHISVYNMSYYINIIVYKCTIFKYKDECENVNTNTHIWYVRVSLLYALIVYNIHLRIIVILFTIIVRSERKNWTGMLNPSVDHWIMLTIKPRVVMWRFVNRMCVGIVVL